MPSTIMHNTVVGQNTVPAFLTKLWKLVGDDKFDDLICWSTGGTSFIIRDQTRFARELLPLYFKHSNMASFIRQLNMYGFRKVVNIEQGGLRIENNEVEFQHSCFLRGHERLLEFIKRKVAAGKSPQDDGKLEPEIVSKMLLDVELLHGKQESLDARLSAMKSENEVLWREVANLRQQHKKQQQIVSKLVQFLLSLVHPNRGIGVRRKIPLMLDSGGGGGTVDRSPQAKKPRLNHSFSVAHGKLKDDGVTSPLTDVAWPSPSRPMIHDITDSFDAEAYLRGEIDAIQLPESLGDVVGGGGTKKASDETEVESTPPFPKRQPDPSSSSPVPQQPDVVVGSPGNLEDLMGVSAKGSSSSSAPMSDILVPVNDLAKSDFEEHLGTLQMELDALKDMLSGSGCLLDTSAIMELFSANESAKGMGSTNDGSVGMMSSSSGGNQIVGTELMHYNRTGLGGGGEDVTGFDPDIMLSAEPSSSVGCLDDFDPLLAAAAVTIKTEEEEEEEPADDADLVDSMFASENEGVSPRQQLSPLAAAAAEALGHKSCDNEELVGL